MSSVRRNSKDRGSAIPPPLPTNDSAVSRLKILSMGEGGCGKSCLIKRYCEGKFVTRYISTIGVDYGVKPVLIDGKKVKVNFWDLSGHPEFFEIRNEFYKDSQGVILCFDASSRNSFDSLDNWVSEAIKFGLREDAVIYLVATKCDLNRAVSDSEAKAWAEKKKYKYYETSAKAGNNVELMFDSLFKTTLESVSSYS